MTRTLRAFVVVVLVGIALLGVFASSAYASLEDTPTPVFAYSNSNPGGTSDAWWREGWGNSLYPDFQLVGPGLWSETNDGYLLGDIYTIDRSAGTIIATATPGNYYRTTFPTGVDRNGGSLTSNTLDILGIYMNPPTGVWPAPQAGTHTALEGLWYYHYLFYSDQRYQNGTPSPAGSPATMSPNPWTVVFGIDVTPPRAVTGLHVQTGLTTSDVTTWTPATRALISWDASETDDLSGTGYYQVLLDDQPYVPETSSTPTNGRVYCIPGFANPNSITIENVPPGAHKLSIQPVDRATNAGPATSVWFYSDPDTPTISWASPNGTVIDPRTRLLSVNASDLAGDPTVKISLNGANLATLTAPPYQITPDLSALATGTYTLTASVTDHLNRTVTISKQVTWNPYGLAGTTTDPSVDVTSTIANAPDSAETSTGGGTGWTNNLNPPLQLFAPQGATDMFYNIMQTPSAIDTANLQNYWHSLRADGTELNLLAGLKDAIDGGGPWGAGPAGSVPPYEGSWYFQWVWYNQNTFGVSSQTYRVRFNVDLTPPTQVQGFSVSPAADTWTSARRANFTWTAKQYDALSGDRNYVISIDGNPVISVNATSALANSATIENMPSGRHLVSIAAVDQAGNIGPASSLYFDSDPDTPAISWILPSNPALNPNNHTFSVNATDAAGDPTVTFSLTGPASLTTTVSAPPYQATPNLNGLPSGTYLLTARATDHMGHSAVVTQSVTWSTYDGSLDTTGVVGTSSSYSSGTWVNTLFPSVSMQALGDGIIYNIVQTPSSIVPSATGTYYHSNQGYPLFTDVADLKDTIDSGGPWNPGPTGSVAPYEGRWYFQWKWHSAVMGSSQQTYRMPFDVDLTPPTAVLGFSASPAAGTWTASQRATFTWTNANYDALSGTNHYNFYIDDVLKDTVATTDPIPNSLTIESMPAGRHKVSISAVDNAGNEGPKTDLYFQSDPAGPSASWILPTSSALNPNNHTFSVNATDDAGDPTVALSLTGPASWSTTLTASPYSVTPDLSVLPAGSYTLSARVTDHMNRSVLITQSVTWTNYDGSLDTTGSPGTSSSYATGTWVNTLFPVVTLDNIGGGIAYNVVQTTSTLDVNAPNTFYHATDNTGPLFDHIVDLKDTIDAGVGTWLAGPAGSVAPYEGTWYFQWRWHSGAMNSANTYRLRFDVDLTPPTAVQNFSVSPASGVWTTQRRAKFTWTNSPAYDTLSGVSHYNLYIDDVLQAMVSANEAVPNQLTIETMPTGSHKVSISAVDNAGNEGPRSDLTFMSDPDVPSIKFTEPTATITPAVHTISLDASDSAGDPAVTLFMSGGSLPATITLATFSGSPYTVTPDFTLMGLTDGTYHLRAVATNHVGAQAVVTKDVVWDTSSTLTQNSAVDLPPGQHIGTSSSNPSALDDPEAWWRQGWGNSLTPDFELVPPSPDVNTYGFLVGTLYTVTTSQMDLDPLHPDLYYRASRGTGTNMNQTVDLLGVYNYPPLGGWRPVPIPGATSGIEGPWYLNLTWFTSKGFTSTHTYHIPMGLDVTPPSVVQSMVVSPSLNSADATSVIATSRINISWAPLNYDSLSGVAYYQIYIDGQAAVPDSVNNPPQGRVYNIPGAAPNSVTIENLSPGRHTIGMAAVDRATNVGKETTEVVIYSDPDTPTVSLTAPANGATVGTHPTVSANASDKGGVTSVVFDVDGQVVLSTTSAPYTGAIDLSSFAAGQHVLTATVTDRFGRKTSDSRTFTLDKAQIALSAVTTSSSGRKVKVTFKVNRASTTSIYLSQTAATQHTTMSSSGGGSFTFTYTYPKGRKYPSATSFYDTFTLTSTDSITKSVVTYSGRVKVTLAKLVKISKNKVKIIYY